MRHLQDSPSPAARAALSLAGVLLRSTTFEAVLDRACEVTGATLPGAHDVSVSLVDEGSPHTAASTGALAAYADSLQHLHGHGPALEAVRTRRPVLVDDVGGDQRWPQFARAAQEAGVRSALHLPLETREGLLGTLNAYSLVADAFPQEHVEEGRALARHTAVLLANARDYFRAVSRAEHLHERLLAEVAAAGDRLQSAGS